MRDVANPTAVSIAAVSNVINHPHLVAAQTKAHVPCIVQEFDFQPDPHALRDLGTTNTEPQRGSRDDSVFEDQKDASDPAVKRPAAPSLENRNMESFKPGDHLSFQMGPENPSGTVDAVMPDKTCFWIWTDGGMGRRLIDVSETAALRVRTAG
jgi:hypothetical protein